MYSDEERFVDSGMLINHPLQKRARPGPAPPSIDLSLDVIFSPINRSLHVPCYIHLRLECPPSANRFRPGIEFESAQQNQNFL